jgi:ferredoxin-type protein NapH
MTGFVQSIAMMLGRAPRKPEPKDITPAAKELMKFKKLPDQVKKRKALIAEEHEHPVVSNKWRYRRWLSIVILNLLFVISYWFDVQLVEGALTASRFVGFHMADLNGALQVMLAYKQVMINLVIGTVTVLLCWWFVGGRAFCSWICPYHLLAEFAEMIHLRLAALGIAVDVKFHRGLRTILWFTFLALAAVTGYTVFEFVNPVGILSRALIYGPTIALLWVVALLGIEIFFSRRFWCRYICPIGLSYGMTGAVSPLQVKYDLSKCLHEGECRKACMVPHVLELTKMGYASDSFEYIGADCTRCGMCIDVCPQNALSFSVRGLEKLL